MISLRDCKVSVVLVNYNKEKYISQCIDSVINQSLKEIEIIIVDDGSSDHSSIIAQQYAKQYSHITYINQKNQGVSAARNIGIVQAKGEYITFLDADDYVYPSAYEQLYHFAVKHGADTIIGNFRCFNEYRTWHLGYMKKVLSKNLPLVRHISTHVELHLTPSASNKLFKTELLNKHGIRFDEALSIGEDLLFTQHALHVANHTVVKDVDVLHYRVNSDEQTLSKRANLSFFKQLVHVQSKLTELYKSLNILSNLTFIEQRQYTFFYRSILNKVSGIPEEDWPKLLDIGNDFMSLISHNLYKVTDTHVNIKLLAHLIIQKDYELFVKFLSMYCKNYVTDKLVVDNGTVYSALIYDFPVYKQALLVNKVKAVHRTEVIKLNGTILTIGGYAFFNGLSTKGIKKELVFQSTNDCKTILLRNTLRTDISYLFSSNQINYDEAGFETVSIDLEKLLPPGRWKAFLRITVEGIVVDSPIEVVLAQLRNSAKPTLQGNLQVTPSYEKGQELTIALEKIKPIKKINFYFKRMKSNLRYDFSFLKARDFHTFSVICTYKFFHRLLKKRDVWLIGERKDTAQDNSYHLFSYIRNRDPKTNAYYVIDKRCSDYKHIESLGNTIQFNSFQHTLYLLTCTKTINSYVETSNMYTEAYKKIVKYYPEWQQNEKIFIQHGVIGVSRVNHVLHKNRMNYSQFVVSSSFEKKHIVEEFGYDQEQVIETGLPRWDALQDTGTGKEILVMPTWRSWIKTEEQLFSSDYWQRYSSLLNNKEFHQILEKYNYTVTFFPHYQMQKLIKKFPDFHPRIRVMKQGEETVQNLLKRHSLLITDYSTVSFDFAYMEKPVIFYQFDYSEFYSQHYNEGPIDHKNDLFGERVKDEKEVIQLLQQPMSIISQDKLPKLDKYIQKPTDTTHSELLYQQLKRRK